MSLFLGPERGPPIESFSGEYRWLSNFLAAPVELDGIVYPTVEHAYQAAKCDDPVYRQWVLKCSTPFQAKHAGRAAARRAPEWRDRSIQVMFDLLVQKFTQPEFRELLLATDHREIIEGNTWGDAFWGVDRRLGGENVLGRLIMEIRGALR
jgi:ribA/ribD-fused uncharacterized protein